MRIILPPSETKRSGGGSVFVPTSLSNEAALGRSRQLVRKALEHLSRDEAQAVKALKLGAKSRAERLHNLDFSAAPAMLAIDRYTGVLYDALDAVSLQGAARQWLFDHVEIQSALFGRIRANDLIPAYRLSASTRIPELKRALKAVWADPHHHLSRDDRWILDLRSQDYVALAPLAAGTGAYLHVTQRSDDGEVRALNHFNKAAKGELVRRLAVSAPQIHSRDDFMNWASRDGSEVLAGAREDELKLVLPAPSLQAVKLNQ